MAYEVPFFEHSDDSGRTFSDYLQIALAVLIFALLGFVVFRSTRKDPTQEIEPELSVETLLETTKEAELEDIGLNEKSETRILIEKFVDENPEAVAALLRNWLNDDWKKMANAELTGVQKAAVLLITLGPEKSASIFKHLKEEEIEELTLEIANTRSISPQEKEDVLNEFYQVCLAQQYMQKNFWKKHSANRRHRMLSQN